MARLRALERRLNLFGSALIEIGDVTLGPAEENQLPSNKQLKLVDIVALDILYDPVLPTDCRAA